MDLSQLGTNSRCFRDRATRNRVRYPHEYFPRCPLASGVLQPKQDPPNSGVAFSLRRCCATLRRMAASVALEITAGTTTHSARTAQTHSAHGDRESDLG